MFQVELCPEGGEAAAPEGSSPPDDAPSPVSLDEPEPVVVPPAPLAPEGPGVTEDEAAGGAAASPPVELPGVAQTCITRCFDVGLLEVLTGAGNIHPAKGL